MLREDVGEGLGALVEFSKSVEGLALVGTFFPMGGRLYNVAALIGGGRLYGLVPKAHLPNAQEFYEARWFAPADSLKLSCVRWQGQEVPVGLDLLFQLKESPAFVLSVEICQDVWTASPPAALYALSGATVLANPSASTAVAGKGRERRELIRQHSLRYGAAYLYASCGPTESVGEVVFSGHCVAAEVGMVLAEDRRLSLDSKLLCVDLDLDRIAYARYRERSLKADKGGGPVRWISVSAQRGSWGKQASAPKRPLSACPFLPEPPHLRQTCLEEAFDIQSTALARRLQHLNFKDLVLGLSGGADSALALLVACRAFETLNLSLEGLHVFSLPSLGTSDDSQSHARDLAKALGVSLEHLSLKEATLAHLRRLGHNAVNKDRVFENVQARERAAFLLNKANQLNALAIGTSDLSEIALGWCTFGGDQLSMYQVNAGLPKTVIMELLTLLGKTRFATGRSALKAILATPPSPELIPQAKGRATSTEALIGPYLLHDFFLYHLVYQGLTPRKVKCLAHVVFQNTYKAPFISSCLKTFCERFIASQFKRVSAPESVKVLEISLSPRGDWRTPADLDTSFWLKDC